MISSALQHERVATRNKMLEIRLSDPPSPVPRPYKLKAILEEELEQFRSLSRGLNPEWHTPERVLLRKKFYDQEYASLSIGCRPGEIRCVIVPQKGSAKSVSPFIFHEDDLLDAKYDDRWRFSSVEIGSIAYLVAWNKSITSGLNKTALKLTGAKMYGPVIFITLDHEYSPTHASVATFKKHAMSLL